jgi:hypothetical protein
MTQKHWGFLLAVFAAITSDAGALAEEVSPAIPKDSVAWRSNYRAALEEAQAAKGMALLWFVDSGSEPEREWPLRDLFSRCLEAPLPVQFIPLRLPTDTTLSTTGKSKFKALRLLDHPAFAELRGRAGIAVIDMRDVSSPHFHRVVSVYPFVNGRIGQRQLTAILELPPGSLTQRTLVWAVRTHEEEPASGRGEPNSLLMQQAASHSSHQAAICRQGHHGWDERFHRINKQLPEDLVAQEVCAESWPGQSLVEAAQECVRSWRQSNGHWDAVRTRHPLFGYDMQRGNNGTWYATGIFARNR